MTESPFHPPQADPEPQARRGASTVARVGVALLVALYSAVLGGAGGLLGIMIILFSIIDETLPVAVANWLLASALSLASGGALGLGVACSMAVSARLAGKTLAVFVAYAVLCTVPLVLGQWMQRGDVAAGFQILAVASLGPMLLVIAYGMLSMFKTAEIESPQV